MKSSRDHKKNKKKKKEKKTKKSKKRKLSASKNETFQERQRRRLLKKERKREQLFGYTNEDNPFRDPNLSQPFVWKKRDEKEIKMGKRHTERSKAELKMERRKLLREISDVQKRRQVREEEQLAQEKLREEEERLRIAMEHQDWERQEKRFLQRQTVRGSLSRIKDKREKIIDIFAKNVLVFDNQFLADDPDDEVRKSKYNTADSHEDKSSSAAEEAALMFSMELSEPSAIVESLDAADLKELLVDMGPFAGISENATVQEYWKALKIMCESRLKRIEAKGGAKRTHRTGEVHGSVKTDMEQMFKKNTHAELVQIENDIKTVLDKHNNGDSDTAIDVEYYENTLKKLVVAKARAKLLDIHKDMLSERLKKLEAYQKRTGTDLGARTGVEDEWKDDDEDDGPGGDNDGSFSPELYSGSDNEDAAADGSLSPALEADDGTLSPPLLQLGDGDEGDIEIVDESADLEKLQSRRQKVLLHAQSELVGAAVSAIAAAPDDSKEAAQMYAIEKAKHMDADEELMMDEVAVPAQVYAWTDKYRPRKPRYFNRVKTGYEWNKYNQTHYDHDNPPPKVVQGYKFNIFYPDLIDKSLTPRYFLEPADSNDFCIIRFSAGPPYEDIAFKVVKQEWGMSRRRGFKCQFERGILQLYFNFQRWRYRR